MPWLELLSRYFRLDIAMMEQDHRAGNLLEQAKL